MPTLLQKLKDHMADAGKDLRVALCGQVGEYAEQGRDLFPSFVVGAAPSTTMLDIFTNKFNNGYVIPI
jgi:archaeosine-15-forming tRNA-guanine transglycosylase